MGEAKTVKIRPPHGPYLFRKEANMPTQERVVLRLRLESLMKEDDMDEDL